MHTCRSLIDRRTLLFLWSLDENNGSTVSTRKNGLSLMNHLTLAYIDEAHHSLKALIYHCESIYLPGTVAVSSIIIEQ